MLLVWFHVHDYSWLGNEDTDKQIAVILIGTTRVTLHYFHRQPL